uniref:ABC transporter domain-containing protein n=1 Tax=Timema douglasi TaxID=61478 RepID=A0A7R8VH92_TIMDO|nr:unnamed protein product [Timema douglasi]
MGESDPPHSRRWINVNLMGESDPPHSRRKINVNLMGESDTPHSRRWINVNLWEKVIHLIQEGGSMLTLWEKVSQNCNFNDYLRTYLCLFVLTDLNMIESGHQRGELEGFDRPLRALCNTTGEVLINGQSIDPAFMANMSGFVPQQDLVVDSLTVREHMEFMAQLKMDRRMIPNQRKRRINSLMSELSLTKCCHTRLSDLSGGEKKRLALAVQFLRSEESFIIEETIFADLYDTMTRGTMPANVTADECHYSGEGLIMRNIYLPMLLSDAASKTFKLKNDTWTCGTSLDLWLSTPIL